MLFVQEGSFGLASNAEENGGYERIWYEEPVGVEEVAFERSVFLLTKARSEALRDRDSGVPPSPSDEPSEVSREPESETEEQPAPRAPASDTRTRIRLSGTVPPELWNRLGTKVIPKLRTGVGLSVLVECSVDVAEAQAASLEDELRQALAELDLDGRVRVERG